MCCICAVQVLSANAESPLNIECLMEDTDVHSQLTRDELEVMVEPFLGRLDKVLRSALEASGEHMEEHVGQNRCF